MSIYNYPSPSVIDEVTFKKTANGAVRAYLHAGNIDTPKVRDILDAFQTSGFEYVAFTLGGKPALEVRGFKKETQLIELLAKHHLVEGKPAIKQDKTDNIGWLDILRKRSIQASGVAMVIADLGFMKFGQEEKNWENTLAGVSYLSGSLTLLGYGRNDQSQLQIREMAQMILDHAKQSGFDIPDNSAAHCIGRKKPETALRKLDNFFRAHPSEIGNMLYFGAGALIAKSALQHHALSKPRPGMTKKQIHEMRMEGWQDTGLGAMTMASGLYATLVKEKSHDLDAPKKHGIGKVIELLKNRPLSVASLGYMVSTTCHAFSTYGAFFEAKRASGDVLLSLEERAKAAKRVKSVPWRALFVGATLVGELLLLISSKGHGEGVVSDNSVDTSVISIAAELIVRQPEHMQENLIQYMGKFLGQPDVLAMKDQEAIDLLRKQVEAMRKNPWAQAIPAAPPAAPLAEESPAWQAKVSSASKAPALAGI